VVRLPPINYDVVNAARRVLEGALGLVPGEVVAVVVDETRRELGGVFEEVALGVGARAIQVVLEEHGARPLRRMPDAVREAIAGAQASLLLCGYEPGETAMRVELIGCAQAFSVRHAHMVGISARSLVPGFSVDPARIVDTARAVRTRVRDDSTLRLRSPAGSDLEVKLDPRHRWLEHSGVVRPGRWENFPSGKLTTSPAEVNGVFVADGSVGECFGAAAGVLTSTPVVVEIERGICRQVRCPDRALQREIESYLREDSHGDRVGALHIGTNVGLLAPVGELVCDLNLPGLHIGFGSTFRDQTGASWSSRVQLGMTGAAADVDLDGTPLLRSGRYLVT
jgi:leucyl aminopeptidase (aminopeptidase T)